MQTSETQQINPSPAFVRALRQVLRPLMRLMLSGGVTFPYLVEIIKSLLVEVAEKDFAIDGKPTSDSRISLLTGLHRKDISRLRQLQASKEEKMPEVVSFGSQLVAQWLGNPIYLDAQGQPKPLPRNVSEGGTQSFEGLVAGVNSDIRSRVVLDEWLRLGVAHIDEQSRVCLNTQAFVPAKGFDEKAYYFGHNLHDHAAAATHNLLDQAPAFLERSVHYKGLSMKSVEQLTAQSKELGMRALLAVNRSAMDLDKSDTDTDTPRQRMTFGIYFYSVPCRAEASKTDPDNGAPDDIQRQF